MIPLGQAVILTKDVLIQEVLLYRIGASLYANDKNIKK